MRLVGRQKSVKITAGILIISVFILALLSLLGFLRIGIKRTIMGSSLELKKLKS